MSEPKRIKAEIDLRVVCPECEDEVAYIPVTEGRHDAKIEKCDFCEVELTIPAMLVREKVAAGE